MEHAALESLAARPRLLVIDPSEIGDGRGPSTDLARRVGADELVRSTVAGTTAGLVRISLLRVRGSDGRVLWTDTLRVPSGAGDLRLVHEAVAHRLTRAFPQYLLPGEAAAPPVSNEDYSAFLALKARIDRDGTGTDEDLARLEAMIGSSPGFLSAYLLGADLAHALFTSTRRGEVLERGKALVSRARESAPEDARTRFWEAQLALAGGDFEAADGALEELQRLDPGDLRLPVLRSRLAEAAGDEARARSWMEEAVERLPSWQRLYRLASLELRGGEPEAARETLQRLLGRAPDNPWGLAKLGELELLYGDLSRAGEIYQALLRSSPTVGRRINLALVHLLEGDLGEASAVLHQALEVSPGHPTVLLNLADVEAERGRPDLAEAHCRGALEGLEKGPRAPAELMHEAQCRLHLGEPEAAVVLTQEALARAPEDAEVVYLAALVYARAGDRTSSLVNLRTALDMGLRPVWLRLPAFDGLRGDPAFAALAAAKAPASVP